MSNGFESLDNVSVHLVQTLDEAMAFSRWLDQRRSVLAIDTETGGLRWWRDGLRTVQVGDRDTGWTIPWADWAGLLKEKLTDYAGDIVMHNQKFDLHFTQHHGLTIPRHRLHDTRAMSHIIDPVQLHGLKPLSARLIHPRAVAGEQLLKEAMSEQKWTWATVPIDFGPYWQYGALDTVLTARIYDKLWPQIRGTELERVYDLERGSTLVLQKMEQRGFRVDLDYTRSTMEGLERYVEQALAWAEEAFGVRSFNSAKQMWDALPFEPDEFTPGGQPRLTDAILERLDHPLAQTAHQARQAKKAAKAYFGSILDLADGDVVHCSTNPLGARTGRMSVSDPPLQQLPRGPLVRDCFVASEGHRLILADYDQMELRVFAFYAQEQGMMEAAAAGVDLHSYIGGMVYDKEPGELTKEERQLTKGVDFGLAYGAGEATIAKTSGRSLNETRAFLAKYHQAFPGVKRFFAWLETQARQRLAAEGRAYVKTWSGRYQPTEDDKLYKLTNYLIQGGCADLLKQKLIDMDRAGLGEFLVLPVHDEVILDVPETMVESAARLVEEVLTEREVFAPVPLTAGTDVYDRWGDKYR